jgi:serine phosphatase RsbU (regulator of sigma subunit)
MFHALPFVEKLNTLICEDPLGEKFAMNLALLDPLKDLVTYISCGSNDLLHIPQGHTEPRRLSSQNNLLGVSTSTEFSETNDNWNAGDLLIMHSLAMDQESTPELRELLNQALVEATTENLLLSAQRQSEAILKKALSSPAAISDAYPKALISIQRII